MKIDGLLNLIRNNKQSQYLKKNKKYRIYSSNEYWGEYLLKGFNVYDKKEKQRVGFVVEINDRESGNPISFNISDDIYNLIEKVEKIEKEINEEFAKDVNDKELLKFLYKKILIDFRLANSNLSNKKDETNLIDIIFAFGKILNTTTENRIANEFHKNIALNKSPGEIQNNLNKEKGLLGFFGKFEYKILEKIKNRDIKDFVLNNRKMLEYNITYNFDTNKFELKNIGYEDVISGKIFGIKLEKPIIFSSDEYLDFIKKNKGYTIKFTDNKKNFINLLKETNFEIDYNDVISKCEES